MRSRRVGVLAALVVVVVALQWRVTGGAQQASDVKADYDRANSLSQRVANKVFGGAGTPTWIQGSQKFWYTKSVRGGTEFVLVDPAVPSKGPAFDHARLATSLSAVAGGTYTAITLPFTTFTYIDNMNAIEFAVTPGGGRGGAGGGRAGGGGGRGAQPAAGQAPPQQNRFRCTLSDYQCTKQAAPEPAAAQGQGAQGQGRGGRQGGGGGQGAGAGQAAAPTTVPHNATKMEALIQNYNVFIRPIGGRPDQTVPLSFDGSEGNAYTQGSIVWSPDGSKLVASRTIPGYQRIMTFVQSSPTDQLQPKVITQGYQKPGDARDQPQPVLFDIATKKQTVIDRSLFPNPYSLSRATFRTNDSRTFTLDYNQRGHQVYRVIEVDAATGQARTLIDETSQTFIYYNAQAEAINGSGRRYRQDTADGREIVWMSQRDGWAHLYLYDRATGKVKNQITKGNWQVHYVDRVDEKTRQIYFRANGMDAGKDPYLVHYFRINFDGTGLTRFTTGDGTHSLTPTPRDWAADQQFYVDAYSRVDLPTVTELRRVSDQSLVLTLEKADATDLLATGWKMPEVFVSKARDNTTDIWGIIIKPTNFDPAKKYPVIENIYAGPQGSFVPKAWSTQTGMQTLAELGFIVVQVDGMGTANRSKAFHDVAFKNLGDAGFPDRIIWHKAIAAKYPWYDITRVGIYGTSAGGQNSMGGVLFHPEFYKAAASSAGCHDNRMDKIWWNEQWMSWPLGQHYIDSSNMENAAKLQGDLLLIVGEMDTNVDPASTMQVVNKLIQANKNFELVVIPGAGHTNGGAYGDHKRFDFFVRSLQGRVPPRWASQSGVNATGSGGASVLDADAIAWINGEDWER